MLQSKYFIKTLREPPKDEISKNAQLLEQACYIKKLMAGVYTYFPLGLRVLNKINTIIRQEMDALEGQEIYMPALQPRELWDKTKRWDELKDIMYQFQDNSGRWFGLATTHEETITYLIKERISSYKDLPIFLYQIQDKFRNEPRAKSGLIRGREFSMKDLYSFHTDEEDLNKFYKKAIESYLKVYTRCGLDAMVIEASGGAFTKQYSHEFQVLSEAGEDKIIFCPKHDFAQNQEISQLKSGEKCPHCGNILKIGKGIEVGNIFKLGTRFSEAFDLHYLDKKNNKKPVVMASYGIGPGRLMGTIAEINHDSNGLIWPKEVTPFQVHLLDLGNDNNFAQKIYDTCQTNKIDILYDDRTVSPGIKLKDADLLGITVRLVISKKTSDKIEIKFRHEKEHKIISLDNTVKTLINYYRGSI